MKHPFLRILSLTLALLLFPAIAGCKIDITGSSAQQDSGVLNFYIFEPDVEDTEWYNEEGASVLYDNSSILREILKGFQTDQTDASVNITTFSSAKEYTDRVQSELKAGGGPDVLIYAPGLFDKSLRKLADEGIFEDLNPYITRDSEAGALQMNQYFGPVMDAFTVDEKRLGLPVTMEIPLFLARKEALDLINTPAGVMDGTGPMELLFRFTESNPSVTKDSLLVYNTGGNSSLMLTGGKSLWDMNQKTAAFNTPEYKAYIEKLLQFSEDYPEYNYKKSWIVQDQNGEYDSAVRRQRANKSILESIRSNTFLFYQGRVGWIEYELGNIVHNFNGSAPQLLTCGDKNGCTVIVNGCLGINQNSKSKRSAYQFIKYALTTWQKKTFETPVLKTALYDGLDRLYTVFTSGSTSDLGYLTPSKPAWDDYVAKLQALTETIGSVYVYDDVITGYIGEALTDIYQKKKTVDAALEDLQEKTLQYLNQ